MNPRISTSMMYQNQIAHMLSKQVRLDHLGQQLARRERMVTAKDDPVAAGNAQALGRTLAALRQYGKNANFLQSRLGLQEDALSSAGDVMGRVRNLTIEAGDGALAPENREAIAIELEKLKDSLLDIANTADGNGRYLFAGTRDASAPFAIDGGKLEYQGDTIQRRIEIAPETFVNDTIPGSEVFFNIGPDKRDVFAVLDQLTNTLHDASIPHADLQAALDAGLRDVTLAGEQFLNARTAIGAQLAQVDVTAELRAANEITHETGLSALRDLDDVQAIGDFNLEKIALQVAQNVFMQMNQMSLFSHAH